MKFKVEFEMSEYHCLECPLRDNQDNCKLQPDFCDIDNDTWEDLMVNCPLEIAEWKGSVK